jgi:Domain of unknown function (DUF6894)
MGSVHAPARMTARDQNDRTAHQNIDARRKAMPRYFFHLTDGKNVLNNHKGIDLAGNAAARADAVALADALRRGEKMPGWSWNGWFVAIVDQHGHKIDEVPIADTLEQD